MNLAEGASLLYSDRKEAQKRLESAEVAYKQVEAADDPMLRTRAKLGLARVYESLFKPDEARKYYEQVVASEKDSPLGKAAAIDAKRLKDNREVAFLEWFASQTPKRPSPFPGMGGGLPGLPNDLPERPEIGLPTGFGLDKIGTGTPEVPPPAFLAPAGASPTATPSDAASPEGAKPDATPPEAKPEEAKPADAAPEGKAASPNAAADPNAAAEKKPE
jgi:hypothetical protein